MNISKATAEDLCTSSISLEISQSSGDYGASFSSELTRAKKYEDPLKCKTVKRFRGSDS